LDLDFEEIAMVTRKFKKFFKKAEGNIKKGSTRKLRNCDHDQFSGCFKCGKPYHIVKKCSIQKEEQGLGQFQNHGKRPQQSSSSKCFSKAMMGAWGETSEEEEDS